MAHECPECGLPCYCHGDIDDILLPNETRENMCDHCPITFDGDGEWEAEEYDDDRPHQFDAPK